MDEALCFGWIDGIRKSVDDESYAIRFTPRKPRSVWSVVNIERAEELERQGRMRPPGRKAFEARVENRSGIYSYEQRSAELDGAYGERFTVVCPDLRGFGDSDKPPGDTEHLTYSKRVMAQDQVEVMRALGFDEFAVVGHDRGARVAHRLALDHAERVTKLALLDIIPTSVAFANVDKELATAAFNWFFSTQPDGLPERLIGAEPAFYLHWILDHWSGAKGALAPEAVAEYERCFDAAAIRATNEEFRAAATVDLAHDEADGERRIACPVLLLWSASSWTRFDVLEVWRSLAEDVRGAAFDCGHFLPEEDPEQTAAELNRFLS